MNIVCHHSCSLYEDVTLCGCALKYAYAQLPVTSSQQIKSHSHYRLGQNDFPSHYSVVQSDTLVTTAYVGQNNSL